MPSIILAKEGPAQRNDTRDGCRDAHREDDRANTRKDDEGDVQTFVARHSQVDDEVRFSFNVWRAIEDRRDRCDERRIEREEHKDSDASDPLGGLKVAAPLSHVGLSHWDAELLVESSPSRKVKLSFVHGRFFADALPPQLLFAPRLGDENEAGNPNQQKR